MKLQKFDYQIKDNRRNKSFIILSIAVVALLAGFIVYKTFAAYKVTETYNIIKGSVAEFTAEKLKISYNLVGEDGEIMSTNEIPSSEEYEYDATKSTCVNGNDIVYDKETNSITIGDNSEELEDSCTIYFNYISLSTRTLYALNLTKDDILEGIPYGPDGTGIRGWYAAPDNYGTSYYFYNDGSDSHPLIMLPNGDWALIVRINGNGTVRVINTNANFQTSFNNNANDNAHLGLMFGTIGANNILETQKNINKSTGLSTFDFMYSEHHYSYLTGDAIYCNDRTVYKDEYGTKESDDTALGTGQNTTYYGAYYRLRNNTPSLICEKKEDSFSSEETEISNGLLSNNFGALSADELYMINAQALNDFWSVNNILTFSPAYFKNNTAYVYIFDGTNFVEQEVSSEYAIFDVMNLKFGLQYTGNGTWDALYEIVE